MMSANSTDRRKSRYSDKSQQLGLYFLEQPQGASSRLQSSYDVVDTFMNYSACKAPEVPWYSELVGIKDSVYGIMEGLEEVNTQEFEDEVFEHSDQRVPDCWGFPLTNEQIMLSRTVSIAGHGSLRSRNAEVLQMDALMPCCTQNLDHPRGDGSVSITEIGRVLEPSRDASDSLEQVGKRGRGRGFKRGASNGGRVTRKNLTATRDETRATERQV